jgi:hypothetical protein
LPLDVRPWIKTSGDEEWAIGWAIEVLKILVAAQQEF